MNERQRGAADRIRSWGVAAGLTLLVGSCAETTVTPELTDPPPLLTLPDKILVFDFAATASEISREAALGATEVLTASDADDAPQDEREQHVEQARAEIGQATAEELSKALVEHLRKLGLPAERAASDAPEPAVEGDAVVLAIHGQFVRIDEGDAVRRIVVGLGVGHSQLDCEVQVYARVADGAVRFEEFAIAARSGHRPGLLEMLPVGVSVMGSAVGAAAMAGASSGVDLKATVSSDAKRAAKVIVHYLASRFYREHWITREQAKQAGVRVASGG